MIRRLSFPVVRFSFVTVVTGFLLFAVSTAAEGSDAESSPVSGEDRVAAIERIAELLSERYVFPEVATKCGEHLRARLKAGDFDQIETAGAFAEVLTEALQSVSHDKHMRVRVRPPERAEVERVNPMRARAEQLAQSRENNFGFEKVERLEGNVGYLDLRYFAGSPLAEETATAAMNFLANSDALIFDMRQNGGGNPNMVRYITSYLFDQPTHLNSLYWRQGDRTQEFWTLEEIPGPRLADVPVFVLTSSRTFSGAEEFSYNLQTQERATLIGEVTGGGANPGGVVPIDDRFGIFIPTGRAINPITGTNWEGVGVEPHTAVSADEAFDVALKRAKEAADVYRSKREEAVTANWSAFERGQQLVEEQLRSGDSKAAAQTLTEVLTAGLDRGLVGEGELNLLGYGYLGKEQTSLAIAAFELNVARFPSSSNVYDSLGEAYMEAERNAEAVASYRKSLELDPHNTNAVGMLEQLQ